MRTALILITHLSLAAPLLAPAPALAAEPSAKARPVETVRFVADTSELDEDAARVFERELAERITPAIGEAGFEVVDSTTADATVRVRLSYFDREDLDYVLELDVAVVGSDPKILERAMCKQCVDDMLYEVMGEQGPRIVEVLRGSQVVAEESTPANPDGNPKIAPIGPMGGVGIGVAALGIGSVIAGAVELSKGKVYADDTLDARTKEFVDHRPPGRVLLGVGAASVVVGVALLVTDLTIRAKKRRTSQSGARALFPVVGEGTVGVGFIQRF